MHSIPLCAIIIKCQIAPVVWNANASDRKIPFTDWYVNFLRYLNNALGTEQSRTGTVRGARVNRVKARMQISRQERLSIIRNHSANVYISFT